MAMLAIAGHTSIADYTFSFYMAVIRALQERKRRAAEMTWQATSSR